MNPLARRLALVGLVALVLGFADTGTAWGQQDANNFNVKAQVFHKGGNPDSGLLRIKRTAGGNVVFVFRNGIKGQPQHELECPRIGDPVIIRMDPAMCGGLPAGGPSIEFFMREIPQQTPPLQDVRPLITARKQSGIGIYGVAFFALVTGATDASFTNVFTDWKLVYTPTVGAPVTLVPKIAFPAGATEFQTVVDTVDPAPFAQINDVTFAFYDVLNFPEVNPGDRSDTLRVAFGPGDVLELTAKCDTFVRVDCPGPPAGLEVAAHITWSAKMREVIGAARRTTVGRGEANFAGAPEAKSTWIVDNEETGAGHVDADAIKVLTDAGTDVFAPFAQGPAGDLIVR